MFPPANPGTMRHRIPNDREMILPAQAIRALSSMAQAQRKMGVFCSKVHDNVFILKTFN